MYSYFKYLEATTDPLSIIRGRAHATRLEKGGYMERSWGKSIYPFLMFTFTALVNGYGVLSSIVVLLGMSAAKAKLSLIFSTYDKC